MSRHSDAPELPAYRTPGSHIAAWMIIAGVMAAIFGVIVIAVAWDGDVRFGTHTLSPSPARPQHAVSDPAPEG